MLVNMPPVKQLVTSMPAISHGGAIDRSCNRACAQTVTMPGNFDTQL